MACKPKPGDIDLRKLAFTLKANADRWTEAMGRETRFCYRCKVWVDAQAHFSHATGECLAERIIAKSQLKALQSPEPERMC